MNEVIKKAMPLVAIAVLGIIRCGLTPVQTAGGSSDTEISAKAIIGSVVDMNGNAVPNAAVWLNPIGMDESLAPPISHGPDTKPPDTLQIQEVMTDSNGTFRISNVKTGDYAIEVNSGDSIAVLLYCTFDSSDTVKKLPVDTLKPMVTITGTIVPDGPNNTDILIDGIRRHVQIDSSGRFQIKVPYGAHKIRYSTRDRNQRGSVSVPFLTPGTVQDIGYIDPSSSSQIPPPCADSACDASAMRLMLNDIGLDSVAVESVATFENGRITAINLRHRGLRALSVEIARLTALETLDVGANQLRSPLREVSLCASLTVLRLDSNDLPFVPNSIGSIHTLTELDLSNNEISSLPISIIELTPVSLKLDNNRLLDMSGAVAQWADAHEPNWRATQRPPGNPPSKDPDVNFH